MDANKHQADHTHEQAQAAAPRHYEDTSVYPANRRDTHCQASRPKRHIVVGKLRELHRHGLR